MLAFFDVVSLAFLWAVEMLALVWDVDSPAVCVSGTIKCLVSPGMFAVHIRAVAGEGEFVTLPHFNTLVLYNCSTVTVWHC